MSRIGKNPIDLPEGVEFSIDGNVVTIKGSRGELVYEVHPDITVDIEDNKIICSIKKSTKRSQSLWGTSRARLANMVKGVSEGFRKELEMHGVGYKAALTGRNLTLHVGFSHEVLVEAPEGISFTVEKELITVEGNDVVEVGQVAANIRAIRKPEPYKGKGMRYRGENVRRKVGKIVGATE